MPFRCTFPVNTRSCTKTKSIAGTSFTLATIKVSLNICHVLILLPLIEKEDVATVHLQTNGGKSICQFVILAVDMTAETRTSCSEFETQRPPTMVNEQLQISNHCAEETFRGEETVNKVDNNVGVTDNMDRGLRGGANVPLEDEGVNTLLLDKSGMASSSSSLFFFCLKYLDGGTCSMKLKASETKRVLSSLSGRP